MSPTPIDVYAARQRLAHVVPASPCDQSDWLSERCGRPAYLKVESRQRTGSFKIRGAFNALAALVGRTGPPGAGAVTTVVTASAGNHGRALAWAARQLGVRALVFTPADAPRAKRDAIVRLGADLRLAPDYDEAERQALAYAEGTGTPYLSPYNDPDVIAGAGTVGLEILETLAGRLQDGAATVLVPVGGGGLVSGIAIAVKAVAPGIRVVGVEVEQNQVFRTSLANGRITEIAAGPTIADGLSGNLEPGSMTFPLVQHFVDDIVVVTEGDVREAMRTLVSDEHLIAEGAGATALAALLSGRLPPSTSPVVAVVSGGNIDTATLTAVLRP